MATKDWTPKGMAEPGVQVRLVLELTQAQSDKIAELSAPLSPSQRLLIQQTWTQTGGLHLYAHNPYNGDEWQIARNGNAMSMGVVSEDERTQLEPKGHSPRINELQQRAYPTCLRTGKVCEKECSRHSYTDGCWIRHAELASQPEGRSTGLHRDSMG